MNIYLRGYSFSKWDFAPKCGGCYHPPYLFLFTLNTGDSLKKICGDPLRKQFKATGTVCIFPEKHKLASSAVTKKLNPKQRYRFLLRFITFIIDLLVVLPLASKERSGMSGK